MSSNNDDDNAINSSDPEKASNLPEDWSPDYFPTSAKPIFKKISILTLGILTLCLFLAYCSQNDIETKQNTEAESKPESNPNQNKDDDDGEDEIF